MRGLIDSYDRQSLQGCWTWLVLAELLSIALAKDEYRATNEDGPDYDDEAGNPAYVGSRGGVELEPPHADQNAAERQATATLSQTI